LQHLSALDNSLFFLSPFHKYVVLFVQIFHINHI
jgi:hypothetical protein